MTFNKSKMLITGIKLINVIRCFVLSFKKIVWTQQMNTARDFKTTAWNTGEK